MYNNQNEMTRDLSGLQLSSDLTKGSKVNFLLWPFIFSSTDEGIKPNRLYLSLFFKEHYFLQVLSHRSEGIVLYFPKYVH